MELVKGAVTHISRSTQVSSYKNSSVSTQQLTTALVNGRAVNIDSAHVPVINDHDEMIIVGEMVDGVLNVITYANLTNQSRYAEPRRYGLELLSALIVVGAVVFAAGAYSQQPFAALIPIAVGVLFAVLGLRIYRRNLLVKRAIEMLDAATATGVPQTRTG